MPREKELTRKITNVIKAGDKLIQDIERDAGLILAAGRDLKNTLSDIKDRFKPKESD